MWPFDPFNRPSFVPPLHHAWPYTCTTPPLCLQLVLKWASCQKTAFALDMNSGLWVPLSLFPLALHPGVKPNQIAVCELSLSNWNLKFRQAFRMGTKNTNNTSAPFVFFFFPSTCREPNILENSNIRLAHEKKKNDADVIVFVVPIRNACQNFRFQLEKLSSRTSAIHLKLIKVHPACTRYGGARGSFGRSPARYTIIKYVCYL